MKRKFISFADSRMRKALERIKRQAEEMQFFDEIELFTEKELGADFLAENAHLLNPWVRGHGYWKWKPYLIYTQLQKMEDGDELYYIDAGCHWNVAGRKRLLEYAEVLRSNPLGIAAFELGKKCSDRRYTKMDVIDYLGVSDNDSVLDSGQICGGHVFVVKKAFSESFVEDWYNATQNTHFIDDSPSILPNFPEFREHRHDQSIFSIMCKLNGAARLPGNETWPDGNRRDWKSMKNFLYGISEIWGGRLAS